jgi:rhamnogalacturonyl hydrolase YesR
MQVRLCAATTASGTDPVPAGKRLPFGWTASTVPAPGNGRRVLSFPGSASETVPEASTSVAFRLAVALDVRDERLVEVRSAKTDTRVGMLDIRYAPVFQVHSLELSLEDGQLLLDEGLALTMIRGEAPLWFFAVPPGTDAVSGTHMESPEILQPHILFSPRSTGTRERLLETVCSIGSVQSFGWEEGCVLDGLYDLAIAGQTRAEGAMKTHLAHFFTTDGSLSFESPRSEPIENRLITIEGTLPFAILARTTPGHPAISIATEFWDGMLSSGGRIQDKDMVSAEGSYTVAYPLASVAASRRDESSLRLAESALAELRRRRDALAHGEDLSLRRYDDGRLTFTNWARAYAWYLLGLVRTLSTLEHISGLEKADLEAEYERVAAIAIRRRLPNGLWSCFVDDADTGVETSGSAGIAAALAIGACAGLGDDTYQQVAFTSRDALMSYLTPDGMFSGVSQSNRGGESLQRSGYRVLSQMASGLLAQLVAACDLLTIRSNR